MLAPRTRQTQPCRRWESDQGDPGAGTLLSLPKAMACLTGSARAAPAGRRGRDPERWRARSFRDLGGRWLARPRPPPPPSPAAAPGERRRFWGPPPPCPVAPRPPLQQGPRPTWALSIALQTRGGFTSRCAVLPRTKAALDGYAALHGAST